MYLKYNISNNNSVKSFNINGRYSINKNRNKSPIIKSNKGR